MMPVTQYNSFNFTAGPTNCPNATETVIATTKAISSPFPNASYGILFAFGFTTGVGGTTLAVTIRRTSLTGTIVLGPTSFIVVASASQQMTYGAVDAISGEFASGVWVITLNITGGAAAVSGQNIYSQVITYQ